MNRRSYWLCFVSSTSLTVHGELNHIIVASRHMFTLKDWLTWVNVGRGCYRVISEHGSPLGLDGRCPLDMHTYQLHMCSSCLWSMFLFSMHLFGHGFICVLLSDVFVMIVCWSYIGYACQCLYVVRHAFTWL